ncbi:hypothetical protein Snoj_15440 [Streptomyces nojiriensis]|uniref:Uncharacterized protein n=3 Tax=Streptomyces nojiriensis TaxID=66374 RepID=A0ABQ3SHL6_9ACTN|nr:hypothetical protein JYK04_07124 [Streptomyces nojiriensis]GGS10269.1 hypothetical protein GCM10010205_44580 [Streptomyces nojiriensis]GHI67626.1 hypothetical protein Snoj_15440 [Streptomyces nojiriensis]
MRAGESVLILVDQETTPPREYIQTLLAVDHHSSPVGIVPISKRSTRLDHLVRLLGDETIHIDISRSRFRLTETAEANLPSAPPALNRARRNDPASVAEDLQADLLVLQGHAGPVDAGFGRSLTLCSRHLHRPGESPVFPCFDTDQCFRQKLHGRSPSSVEGLFNPMHLTASLAVIDGCGTIPVPGSIFNYETSIARCVMESQVRAAVMTHGVSASPLSALIVFLGTLADGCSLGEAVREANHHVRQVGSSTSINAEAAAPWAVLGNPDIKVSGLPLIESAPRPTELGAECSVAEEFFDSPFGGLVSPLGLSEGSGPFDAATLDGRWVRGALSARGRAYLWIAGPGPNGKPKAGGRVKVLLSERPEDPTSGWRRRCKWIQANKVLLHGMADTFAERGGEEDHFTTLISLWDEIGREAELAAFAAAPHRRQSISPPLASRTERLDARITALARVTARTIAVAAPVTGARLSRLWSPPWLPARAVRFSEPCSCGCPLVGEARRHPLLGLVRVGVRCPACGPVGDVCGERVAGVPGAFAPTVVGGPKQHAVPAGAAMEVRVRRLGGEETEGFASAALFEPFRQRRVLVHVEDVQSLSTTDLAVAIPADWPPGLSQAVVAVVAGTEISFLDFDIIVQSRTADAPVTQDSSGSSASWNRRESAGVHPLGRPVREADLFT